MTTPQSPVLEFPVMLHGRTGAILRKVSAKGQEWAREYVMTGAFSQPRRMRQVPPGEVVIVHSGGDFDIIPHPRWRVHLFSDVFMHLDEGVPDAESERAREAFESFCLSTPWGALYHAVSPSPPRSAQRMARQLAALLRFWDVLQGPRYAFWFDRKYTLEELVEDIYGMTLEAWCPGGAASVREHLTLTVERMARATREECMEAVLRVLPVLMRANADLKHREVLSDPDFLRERLDALRPEEFESLSSAYRFSVNGALYAWDRALAQQ
ncbi:hypothetical protein D187_005160 [Cystobacter fuscus DSM 2262]|uniref:Uncharacterized protein n=1 Tax=Cystobacter fuscus (strain ATCC 25194 / DSM 2262 / NBRC 100088 / M29) TaxID=1242864 RepID=S9PNJ1_CYSF2|nr:hypothetical protein [Cystobacter fuscus]EPX64027.1 hypothetical protein D187_005160 [Cystobacter fuscus DSM 2262]